MKPRKKALDILVCVQKDGAYSNLEIASSLAGFETQDKAFITRLVYGTLGNKIQSDYILGQYLSKPIEKLDTEVLLILEMAVYQHFYMDSVPDYAIINESVELTRKCGKSSASGFVNGVLRKALSAKMDFSSLPEGTAYRLSITYSVQKEICSLIMRQYGEKAEEIIKNSRDVPPFTLRTNTLKITSEELINKFLKKGINASQGKICPDCIEIKGTLNVAEDELFKEGLYYPQNEASAMAAYVLAPNAGETVIDMCAAPGGKTSYIAQLMGNKGKIHAFDLYEHKMKIISDTARRLGVDIIYPSICDGTVYNEDYKESADKVIVDCPCSGLGIIRKKPELEFKKSNLPEIQYKILENAAKYLKTGGEMVYSTCTLNKEENIVNVQKFLDNHKNFEMCDIERYFKGFCEQGKGWVQILTGEFGMDGFFIAKLKKVGEEEKL
ncbi:MAG: 16S rRNA (cytosine(967)-C(5))-methyltransferase RsmB [Bacillota bacterium]|nr:16S rRNA (cytosine(967)-C(5))-methyltransferase RsmB [Bacillota bacterium]